MKYCTRLLIVSLVLSAIPMHADITSSYTKELETQKNSFMTNLKAFVKCVRGDKDCDPQKVQQYRIGLAVTGAALVGGIATLFYLKGTHLTAEQQDDLDVQLKNVLLSYEPKPYEVINLLKRGARIDTKNNPLFGAKDSNIAQILINAGANVNEARRDGETPLFNAADRGNAPVVKVLLLNGANIKAQLKTGETPLEHVKNEIAMMGENKEDQRYKGLSAVLKELEEAEARIQ